MAARRLKIARARKRAARTTRPWSGRCARPERPRKASVPLATSQPCSPSPLCSSCMRWSGAAPFSSRCLAWTLTQIVGLVSFYPTNYLICHRPLRPRKALRSPAFIRRSYAVLAKLSLRYPPRSGTFRCITHPFATRQHPKTCYRSTCMCKACRQRSI